MKLFLSFLVCVLCLMSSCTSKPHDLDIFNKQHLSNSEFSLDLDNLEYVKDTKGKLNFYKDIGEFRYSIQYIPAQLIALRELGVDSLNKKLLVAKTKEAEALSYYNLTIENKNFKGELLKYNLNGESEYQERLYYFSFRMQEDLKLIDNGDTLNCELFHFERTYDLVPHLRFVLAFKNNGNNESKFFSFEDVIFKNGKINIAIDKSALEHLRQIKTI